MNNLESLEQLVRAVEDACADIAPTYSEYMQIAFAIANSCGESGRPYFHRICRFSFKYRQEDADVLFSQALRKGNGKSTLGSVFYLADRFGVHLQPLVHPPVGGKVAVAVPPVILTHTRAYNKEKNPSSFSTQLPPVVAKPEEEANTEKDSEEQYYDSNPLSPLPCFPEYQWPSFLQRVMDCGARNAWQRDVLFLTSNVVMGICLAPAVRVLYEGKRYHSCLQLFVVAPPASGKGVMTYLRYLAEPFHRELRRKYEREMREYQKQMNLINCMGKQKMEVEMPDKPVLKLMLIPADNSCTGIQQNLIDSGGRGIILEPEADTMFNSIQSEYGHWGDVLRKSFDEAALSYNRRGNGGEYRESETILLGVSVSGTPGQFIDMVESPEKGGFSRQLFYYMQPTSEWMDPLSDAKKDLHLVYTQLGKEWKQAVDNLKKWGNFTLIFTDRQREVFNESFKNLLNKSRLGNGEEMAASVKRLGINIARIMEVVALCRLMDDLAAQGGTSKLMAPADSVGSENRKDGAVSHWQLSITDEDFEAVLRLLEPLYEHSLHLLTLLKVRTIKRRDNAERAHLFESLPPQFTFDEFIALAEEMHINFERAKSWLMRAVKKGTEIQKVARGVYRILNKH